MKRRHLFEFEDLPWFPDFLRVCMTRYIAFIHKLFGTASKIEGPLGKLLEETGRKKILDMCSGSGGPMLGVFQNLRNSKNLESLELTMSDLYPNKTFAEQINSLGDEKLKFSTTPIDAAAPSKQSGSVRTMICSFHHMPVPLAKKILKSAQDSKSPLLIYEISDNSHPQFANWLTLPIGMLMVLVFTPFVRPLSFTQIFFTYLVPILPLVTAWDGAVSNVRTYTESDLHELLSDIKSDSYTWQVSTLKGKGGKSILLTGKPAVA